ncbi:MULTISPECIES: VWA domain-containing protein [Luteimonas]|uniref:VWA domain-containing protein n=1 Tax=Luteimonas TaxID=83614 RepID=UPI000C7D7BEE|nr:MULTISPECIES: VWA domain-containing protein [Luteimonas]
MTLFDTVHFLRPQWLWLLLALPLLAWGWLARRRADEAWRAHVDAHLLPHLLERGPARRAVVAPLAWALAVALAVLALAGPAWRHAEQPLQTSSAPLVVALDLSSSILARDLPPSRLLQVRAKLAALLAQRDGGQVALLAYADDAFTVAPLTEDVGNVALYLDALSPDIMPVDGSRAERAIAQALRLLTQAGAARGDILVVSDHVDDDAVRAAASASVAGYRVSALGLGTPVGVTVPDRDGGSAVARLDAASLGALAAAGGGAFETMTTGPGDLQALGLLTPDAVAQDARASASGTTATRVWRDEGYWLLLPLLLLCLAAFRRGATTAVLVLAVACSLPPAHAQTPADASPPGTLWKRADQAEHERVEAGAAAYRAERYEDALRRWQGVRGADAAYNRGNALAKAGRYDEAIRAYDEALAAQPGMADAEANRQAVLAAQQRKPPPGPGDDSRGQPQPRDDASAGSPGDAGQPSPSQGGQAAPPDPGSDGAPPSGDPTPGEGDMPEPAGDAGTPADQQAADAAMRDALQRALDAERSDQGDADADGTAAEQQEADTPAERERRQANDAWLRRLPDDPGGLLRAKFLLEHERRQGGAATR